MSINTFEGPPVQAYPMEVDGERIPSKEEKKEFEVELPKPTLMDKVKDWCRAHPTTVKVINLIGIFLCIAGTLGMIMMAPMVGIPLAVVIALCIMNGILVLPSIVTIVAFDQLFPPLPPSEKEA